MKRIWIWILMAACLTACDKDTWSLDIAGMFAGQSPNIEQRFPESMSWNEAHGYSTIQAPAETYNIYVATDSHVCQTRICWEKFIYAYRADSLCPVALHLGDLIDAQGHFEYMKNALTDVPASLKKRDTLLATAGNHDLFFGQWTEYVKYWHTATYYFIVQTPSGAQDLYIVLDSSEGTLGSTQLKWFQNLLLWSDKQPFRHRIVATHTHLFKGDTSQGHTSNYALEETYEIINQLTHHNIDVFWCGHDHNREVIQLKTVTCYVLDALQDSADESFYTIFTMSPESITPTYVVVAK